VVAALYVHPKGVYAGLPDVDMWPESRDARLYAGPHPVVAHPPCSRWCRLAGLVEARWGHKKGEDGGCFAAALASVRAFGGVLEHPAYSDAFAAHDLPAPKPGGWQRTLCGGWFCHVEQGLYGHPARKATWLYAHGVDSLPSLNWREMANGEAEALVSACANHTKPDTTRRRIMHAEAARTPIAFRDLLLDIARSVHRDLGATA
jgi:hypothetical protein